MSLINTLIKVNEHVNRNSGDVDPVELGRELGLSSWLVEDILTDSYDVDDFVVHIWEALDGGDKPCAADDQAWADELRSLYTGDQEDDHVLADHFITRLLEELGFTETVRAWDECPKWYA